MKKNILTITALGILFMGQSCTKSTPSPETQTPPLMPMAKAASTFKFYQYGTDITEEDFLKNPNDSRDEKFNYINHAITLGLLEIYRNNPEILNSLVKEIDVTRNKEVNLFTFAEKYPDVNNIFNTAFQRRCADFSNYQNDWKKYVKTNYVYDTTYIPFARFINEQNGKVNISEQPFISEPLEINEEKFTSFNDNLPLWINNSNQLLFSTINEKGAFALPNPIIAVCNGFWGEENEVYSSSMWQNMTLGLNGEFNPPTLTANKCGLNPLPIQHTHQKILHYQFKINDRYEGSGKSEYVFVTCKTLAYKPTSNSWVTYGVDMPNAESLPTTTNHKKQVDKSQIGQILYYNFDVFSPDTYTNDYCFELANMNNTGSTKNITRYFVVGAYEDDWGNSAKDLGWVADPYTTTLVYTKIKGHRKYKNEWYYFNPDSNYGFPFQTWFPTNFHTYQNYNKGQLMLKRTSA